MWHAAGWKKDYERLICTTEQPAVLWDYNTHKQSSWKVYCDGNYQYCITLISSLFLIEWMRCYCPHSRCFLKNKPGEDVYILISTAWVNKHLKFPVWGVEQKVSLLPLLYISFDYSVQTLKYKNNSLCFYKVSCARLFLLPDQLPGNQQRLPGPCQDVAPHKTIHFHFYTRSD